MFFLFKFLFYLCIICNCTAITYTCRLSNNDSHRLDKRQAFVNLNEQRIGNTTEEQTLSSGYYEEDRFFYNRAHIHKRSKQKAKEARKLTEKLFELFQKLDLGVDQDLVKELTELRQKFNIRTFGNKTFFENKTQFNLPIPTYGDNPSFTGILSFGNVTTIKTTLTEYDDNAVGAIDYYAEETETEPSTTILDYNTNTEDNYDDDVVFRKALDSGVGTKKSKTRKPTEKDKIKKIIVTKGIENTHVTKKKFKGTTKKNKKVTGKIVTTEKTASTGKMGKTVTGKIVTGKTIPGEAKTVTDEDISEETESSNAVTHKRVKSLERNADVTTIIRVKGVWLNGHCRCNMMMRSTAHKMHKINFICNFLLYLYYFLY